MKLKHVEVKYICKTCEDFIKQYAGTENFIEPQTEFCSLTEAVEHVLQNRDPYCATHNVDLEIHVSEDEQKEKTQ